MVWRPTWLIYWITGLTVFRGGVWEEPQKQDRWESWREEEARLKHDFYRWFFAQTLIMERTCDAALKLESINLANQEGNRASARQLGADERTTAWSTDSMKQTSKPFWANKSRQPEAEELREDWVDTQSSTQEYSIHDFSVLFSRLFYKHHLEAMSWGFLIKVSQIFPSTSHFSKGGHLWPIHVKMCFF